MKIGILTHHYINNFGAFLQAYALCNAVQKLYPEDDVSIINYVNIKHFVINSGGWFRFYKDRETFREWAEKVTLPASFSKCRKEYMHLSKLCLNAKQINALGYDCIIVGSDEVWNYKDNKGNSKVKFGIGLDCPNLIAYAPSVGQSDGSDMPAYVKEGISRFKALSARDELTTNLVEDITKAVPTQVLDPTFLTDFPKVSVKKTKRPYLVFYYCENLNEEIKDQIIRYAKEHNMDVYGAGECDKRYSDVTVKLTPFEWISMFRDAEFVFTGTFHGAVFSILNRRQFKVYLSNKSRIAKVGALLKLFKIEDRNIGDDFCFDLETMKNEINYDKVFQIIEAKKKDSLEFLRKAIDAYRGKE